MDTCRYVCQYLCMYVVCGAWHTWGSDGEVGVGAGGVRVVGGGGALWVSV